MKYLILMVIPLVGCTQSHRRDVKCWSGGTVIYEGVSEMRVEHYSDGFYFQDANTHKWVTVGGNCVIQVSNGT